MNIEVAPRKYWRFNGSLPADKSITHRALILSTLADGTSLIENYSDCLDCRATLKALKDLGADIEKIKGKLKIKGRGLFGYSPARYKLNAANSGSTLKFLTALLCGQRFNSIIDGDSSLRSRAVNSIVSALKKMGACIEADTKFFFPPLKINGRKLNEINYKLPVYSAQLKTTVLLAALLAEGRTLLTGKINTRDHTERILKCFGADISVNYDKISIKGLRKLKGAFLKIKGDPSSASFFITMAVLLPDAEIVLKDINLNPTRIVYFKLLKKMGADIKIVSKGIASPGEPYGDVFASSSKLKAIKVDGLSSSLILDEVPLLALAATQADGETVIKDIEALKFKECNRIKGINLILRKFGANTEAQDTSLKIYGKTSLNGAKLNTFCDHRLVMMSAVASSIAKGESLIENFKLSSISFPNFWDLFYGGKIK